MKKILVFFLIFLSYFNTMAQKKTTTNANTKAVTSYKYIDGSNNTYIINNKNVVYVPITPKNSSSGMYSGGKAFEVAISLEQATEINNLFADALKNKEIQLETRPKGAGTIIKIMESVSGETTETIIIKMNAKEKLAIEKWLKALN